MLKKVIHFIKYNNFTVLILAIIFLFGTGVFAQTETGQAVIGSKQTSVEGTDNSLLLEVDLENIDMDFKIEKIESDDKFYYITYTYLNIVKENSAWQYQLQEKVRKISKKLKKDLGVHLAEELSEEYEARLKELKEEQLKAQAQGEEKRVEVVEYNGLIGQTLELASRVFPNYEPVKKQEVPSPDLSALSILPSLSSTSGEEETWSEPDDLTDIYNNYIEENDPDRDDFFGILDNCSNDYNPLQIDSDEDGIGDECDPTPLPEQDLDVPSTSTPDTTGGGATSTEDVIKDIEDDQVATSTETEIEPEVEIPEVEIIELPVEEETSTSTEEAEMPSNS